MTVSQWMTDSYEGLSWEMGHIWKNEDLVIDLIRAWKKRKVS